jgi:hypothetical protein
MLFDNEKASTANTPSIRNRRNIQPPSPKGAICLFTNRLKRKKNSFTDFFFYIEQKRCAFFE